MHVSVEECCNKYATNKFVICNTCYVEKYSNMRHHCLMDLSGGAVVTFDSLGGLERLPPKCFVTKMFFRLATNLHTPFGNKSCTRLHTYSVECTFYFRAEVVPLNVPWTTLNHQSCESTCVVDPKWGYFLVISL